jgi:hypothetical protein
MNITCNNCSERLRCITQGKRLNPFLCGIEKLLFAPILGLLRRITKDWIVKVALVKPDPKQAREDERKVIKSIFKAVGRINAK